MACPPRRTSFAAAVGLKILLQTSEAVAGSSSSGSRPHLLREGDDLHTTSPGHQSSRAALIGYDGSEFLASDPVVLGPMDMERSSSSSSSSPSLVGDRKQSIGSNSVGGRKSESVVKSSTVAKNVERSTTPRSRLLGRSSEQLFFRKSAGSHELLRRSTGGEHEHTHTKDSHSSIRSTSEDGGRSQLVSTSDMKQSSVLMLLGRGQDPGDGGGGGSEGGGGSGHRSGSGYVRPVTVITPPTTAPPTIPPPATTPPLLLQAKHPDDTVAEDCQRQARHLSAWSSSGGGVANVFVTACQDACIAREEHCYGLQPADLYIERPSPIPVVICSDACLDAMDELELACENCTMSRYAYPGSAQAHRYNCGDRNITFTTEFTVGEYCMLEASYWDGTGCEDACKAYYQTCYEADEDAHWDDVVQDDVLNDAYCTEGCYSARDSYVAACPNGMDGPNKDSGSGAKDWCDSTTPPATTTATPVETTATPATTDADEEQVDGASSSGGGSSSGLIIGVVVAGVLLLGGVGTAFATGAIGGGGEAAEGEGEGKGNEESEGDELISNSTS